ncbi:unnamed protein product [Symbiodinium microadriaticum]|nr:unnamed protein product [Symbiodinium microadriaticum]
MEGGFAIALVALATWAALLPGAFWEALGLAVRDGGRRLDAPACGWAASIFLAACLAFGLSGMESRPGPVPTVLLLNRWRVFTGADTTLNWEVAPARLANGSTVDLWSWQPVSFAEPRYGRRGRWMSFPSTRPGSPVRWKRSRPAFGTSVTSGMAPTK